MWFMEHAKHHHVGGSELVTANTLPSMSFAFYVALYLCVTATSHHSYFPAIVNTYDRKRMGVLGDAGNHARDAPQVQGLR